MQLCFETQMSTRSRTRDRSRVHSEGVRREVISCGGTYRELRWHVSGAAVLEAATRGGRYSSCAALLEAAACGAATLWLRDRACGAPVPDIQVCLGTRCFLLTKL